jgi:serine/threonine protein kinase
MLDKNCDLKVIDFGLATLYDPSNPYEGFCGTKTYSAPETLIGHTHISYNQDIWGVGLFFYSL